MRKTSVFLAATGFLLLAVCPAHAQIAALGKGWFLESAGSITSAPSEVISGKNSIKGSFSGPDTGMAHFFLWTSPTFVQFAPKETYTISLSYRILTAGSAGFQFGFFSSSAQSQGIFLPTSVINGAAGTSGTATLTSNLGSYSDVQVGFSVGGTGAIAIDDIRVTNSAGQLFASEDAEGPSLAQGPLNFQLTDAMALLPPARATALAAAAKDLDGDGHPEVLLTLYGQPSCSVPLQPIIIESSVQMRLATPEFFPAGTPVVQCTPMIQFADINSDGLTDIVFADAGLDAPPFTGSRIGVALNLGGGKYHDVSSLIPADQQTTRSYSIAVGDVLSDGHTDIVLPDQSHGSNTALLRWNGGGFDEIRNWVPLSLWTDCPSCLCFQSWMVLSDFDQDGKQDLLVTGNAINPNFQILFGMGGDFTKDSLVVLTDGPWGHLNGGGPQPDGTVTTGEILPVVVADFNNDGLPDIFAIERSTTLFANGSSTVGDSTYQVRLNQGSRKFVDVSPSPYLNLGRVEYQNLMAIDMNNDGFLDVVGTYSTDPPPGVSPQWGTTFFLNDGTGAFQVIDGAQLIGATTTPSNGQRWNLGAFVPTVVNRRRTEGIVYESVCGLNCLAPGLNLYKVVANGSIGTGPNFIDPATLGVPGFNEFYYLRHYPDAAAAVQAGQYPTGLAHYLAVGKAKGYLPHAPNAQEGRLPVELTPSGHHTGRLSPRQ